MGKQPVIDSRPPHRSNATARSVGRGKSYEDFFDATGIYVNALTTPNAIYIPVYDLAADEEAIAIFESYSDREIIPIYMGGVALLGGSLNCLSWCIQ